MSIILMVAFFVLLFVGMPVFLSMGISTFVSFVISGRIPLIIFSQRVFSGIDTFPIMTIPLFILAADLMSSGKLTELLIDFANDMIGHVVGGLGHVNVLVSMIFAGISGSAMADAAGPGAIIMKMMRKAGYDRYYSGALTAASSVIGIIIPPSIPMVIYALGDPKTSITGLFLAGVVPGVLIGVVLMCYNAWISIKSGYRFASQKVTFKKKLRSTWKALPALVMPAIIVGFTLSGITTPTEASAIAVAYALLIGLFVTRTLTVKALPKIFLQSAIVSSSVLMIVAMGSAFSWSLTYARVPQTAALFISSLTTDPVVLLSLIAVLTIITGMFVDTLPAIMILTSVLAPIANSVGINSHQVATVIIVGIGIGMLTPPIAPLLFITSSIGKIKLEKLVTTTFPLVLTEVMVLILLILVPEVSLWLPRLFGLIK